MTISKSIAIVGIAGVVAILAFGMSAYAKESPRKEAKTHEISEKASAHAVCMQSAIAERENSIIAAMNTYHAALVSALQVRRDAFTAALSLTDKQARKDAEKSALVAFRTSRKSASDKFKIARKAASDEFAKDRKACKV